MAILLFDGECGFCRVAVAACLSLDRTHALTPVSFEDALNAGFVAPDGRPALRTSWHVVDADGWHSAGAAIPLVFEQFPHCRRVALVMSRQPRFCRMAYQMIARRRTVLGRFMPRALRTWADVTLSRALASTPPTIED